MVSGADATPASGMMRGRMRGPLAKTYPVSAAVDAIENGIEKRARRVLAPGWIKLLLAMRDFIPQFVERDVAKTMPEVERAFDADIAARGAAASAAVGAGGAADTKARELRSTEVRQYGESQLVTSVRPYLRTSVSSRASAPTQPLASALATPHAGWPAARRA